MNEKIYQFILFGLEKLDKRDTVAKRIGYKIFRYYYPKMFQRTYKMSLYDPRARCGHDIYLENVEYEMRMNEDGGDYA